uniref:TauD/TfdA-like domain-containing protein n=1 Tax=Psilocybe cubensis TaxID=181762 RepID=A0A8H7Y691_PSICU
MTALVERVTDLLSSNLSISSPEAATTRTAATTESIEAPVSGSQQPDIEYHPDEAKWKARTARRLAEDPTLPQQSLPEGFPKHLDSPLVWEGKDWTEASQWEYTLTAEHLKEIDDAVKHFRALDKPFGYISPATFPLPTLAPVLSELAHELHNGRGFFVLRTIPVDSYSREDNILIYAGISSYVGGKRAVQDAGNIVVGHIKDLSDTNPLKTIGAPAYTTDKQVFHTDIGDIISLFVLETAAQGGTSRISSSWRVYNELAETRPDLIRTLAEPWPFDTFGYARRVFTGYLGLPRSQGIPPITEAQAEALDAIHFLAEKHSLGLSFQKGDIQYINNLSIFHGRDGYVDAPDRRRHLLRLWPRNEELAWKIPDELQHVWKRLYETATPDNEQFPLEPEILKKTKGGAVYV